MMHTAWSSIEEVPSCVSRSSVNFQGHTGKITVDFDLTPDWIHWWLLNDAHSLNLYRKGTLLFSKIIRQTSRSHRTKKLLLWTCIERFRTATPVWIHPWPWNDAQSLIWYRRGALLFSKVIHQTSRSYGLNSGQILARLQRQVAAIKSSRSALCNKAQL